MNGSYRVAISEQFKSKSRNLCSLSGPVIGYIFDNRPYLCPVIEFGRPDIKYLVIDQNGRSITELARLSDSDCILYKL
jgi:hypothetical protein